MTQCTRCGKENVDVHTCTPLPTTPVGGTVEPMSIKCCVGTKVRLITDSQGVCNGYEGDKKRCEKNLDASTYYTVHKMNIKDWSSTVELKERPGLQFNTVCFYECLPTPKSQEAVMDVEKAVDEITQSRKKINGMEISQEQLLELLRLIGRRYSMSIPAGGMPTAIDLIIKEIQLSSVEKFIDYRTSRKAS